MNSIVVDHDAKLSTAAGDPALARASLHAYPFRIQPSGVLLSGEDQFGAGNDEDDGQD